MDETRRNVLLVTVDSLRYDVDHGIETDILPEGTVSFDRAFATGPGTTPSFPALLTGTLPLSHGGLGPLTAERPRIASAFRQAGFSTGGFQCNPFLSRHFNYEVGFDAYEDYQNPLMGLATRVFPRGIELSNPTLAAVDDVLHLTDAIKWVYRLVAGKPRPYVSADVVTDDTIEWIASTDRPFFAWAHYMDVHHPCFPPESYRAAHGVADVTQTAVTDWYSALVSDPDRLTDESVEKLESLYDAAIEYTRNQIGRIVDHLEDTGILEETVIVVTSDHGELFGDHGEYGKPERMYDELLRVPLYVTNGPESLSEANDELVSLLDVPPLVADTVGVAVPESFRGQRPGASEPREVVLAEHEVEGDVIVGARSADWLYEHDEIRGKKRLYDLRDGFTRVEDTTRPAAETVRDAVDRRLAELDIDGTHLSDQVEGDVEDRLEELGYL